VVFLKVLRLFLDNRVGVLLLLPAILALYLIGYFLGYNSTFGPDSTVAQLIPYLAKMPTANVLAHFVMLLLNAIALNWVFNSREFLEKNTFIVSLNYLIFASFFHTWGEPSWLFVAQLFCILGLGLFFGVKPQQNSKKAAFNASFAFGLSVFFEPSFIYILPILLLMFGVLRGFFLREMLLMVIGFLMPIGGLLSFEVLNNQQSKFKFVPDLHYYAPNWQDFTLLGLLIVVLVFSLLGLRARLLKASLKLKKQTQILTVFTFLILALGLSAFFLLGQIGLLSLVILPFSFYFSYALLSSSLGISSHLFFYILFGFSLLKFLLFTI
jgi:hypothetical protein